MSQTKWYLQVIINFLYKEEILKWANGCMEFVYKDLGYTKEWILHSVLYLDEKTPHIHWVLVPLVKKFDKRDYIKDQNYLSILQDNIV